MIDINYKGRLGNNIFQYAVASILSKKNGKPINSARPFFLFKDINNCEKNNHAGVLGVNDDNFLNIIEKEYNTFTDFYIDGYFQTSRFVTEYRDSILDLFNYNYDIKEGTFIHLRIGDLLDIPTAIGKKEYFIKAIEESGKRYPIYISSDSPHHPLYLELLNLYGMIPYNGSAEETLIFGSQFKTKILSLGTFSWWIGFFNTSNVYYPDPEQYLKWHGDIFCYPEWNKITC